MNDGAAPTTRRPAAPGIPPVPIASTIVVVRVTVPHDVRRAPASLPRADVGGPPRPGAAYALAASYR